MTDSETWPYPETRPALPVLRAYLRGEDVNARHIRHALESLLEAWDTAEAHASYCHRKMGKPSGRRGPPTPQELQVLVEEVVAWHGRLADEPLDTRMADDAQWALETMRPGR